MCRLCSASVVMQDVWKKLLVQGVVLAILVTVSESENVLKHPKCRSGPYCQEMESPNRFGHDFFYCVKGPMARNASTTSSMAITGTEITKKKFECPTDQWQQVKVTYESDKFLVCCNCRSGDPELAIDDPILPTMSSSEPTIIKQLEFVGCLVPNGSYHDAMIALNIRFSNADGILMLSELPPKPHLKGYHLKGLPIKKLIITARTDNPSTRPRKDFLNGLPKLKILELKEGVEPEEEARMLLPESLETLMLFNTGLLLQPVNATETQRNESHWLSRLTSLKYLRLREKSTKLSKRLVVLPPLTHTAFPHLTVLVLSEMSIAPMSNNESWLKDSNLQNLIIKDCWISIRQSNFDSSSELPEFFFEGANITYIDFSNNTIRYLPEDMFAPLQSSLRVLDLSHNQLNGSNLVRAVQSLNQLNTLKVNNNPLGSLCGSGPHYGEVDSGLPMKQLRWLELRRTQATRICKDWIENDYLSVINLDRNNITLLRYRDLRMRRKENSPVTLIMRIKKNNTVNIVIGQDNYDTCLKESVLPKNGGTRKRVQVKLKLNSFACDCNAYWFRKMLQNCSLLQPEEINHVNCSTSLEEFPLLTQDRDNLTCPYLGSCPTGCFCNKRLPDHATIVRCNGTLTQAQSWPPGLIALHVEPGTLTAVPHRGVKLVELHAPNNNITNLDEQDIPKTLRVLDLRNNSIAHITTAAAQALVDLSTDVDYNVSFAGNPLECACEDETAIRTLQRAKITDWNNTKCIDGGYVVDKITLCDDKMLPILLGVMGALLMMILVGLTLFYFRPRIRQFLFERGLCLGYVLNVKDDVDDPMKTRDVFISYSHKDDEIAQKLIKALEWHGYSTIEHIRDWEPGETIHQQIVDSVMKARRTLLLLSENYVKSDWSKEEFQVAHAHAMERGSARVIVVLLCDLLSIKNLPDDLRLYLKTNTYLEYSKSYFWDKLWRVMPQSRVVPPPSAIGSLQDEGFKGKQVTNVPTLSLSQQSIDKDLAHCKLVSPVQQFENGSRNSSGQASPVTPIRKKHLQLVDNRSSIHESPAPLKSQLQEKAFLHYVREKQIIADPALLLSRLSLDENRPLMLVATVQQSRNGSGESSAQASPVTPVVTEPPQFDANKSTLVSNMQREPMAPVMHAAVSPSAC